jgi:hypothetical protein
MGFAHCLFNPNGYPKDSLKIALKRARAKNTESGGAGANLQPRLANPFTLFMGAEAGVVHGPFHGGF